MFSHQHLIKNATLMVCLCITAALNAVATRLDIRSQSENAARDLAGLTTHIHVPLNGYHGTIALTPQYSRSCDAGALTRTFFGSDACSDKTIAIKGSDVLGRNNQHDWVAENFYLANDFQGEVSFTPRIEQSITDVNLHIAFYSLLDGFFINLHAPVVWTQWDLQTRETISSEGTGSGWLGLTPFTNSSKLLGSFTEYACQELVPTPTYSTTAGQIRTAYPLTVAKICTCSATKAALSDMQADIGWDYMRNTYHVGVFARIVAPTGTRPKGEYLFEPTIGNGKHWELGGGITSRAEIWKDSAHNHTLTMHLNANVTHLFNAQQQRVFDLKGFGPLSRYLLVEKINTPVATLNVSPAANLTYRTVNVSAAIQTDMVAMLSYVRKFFAVDIGYNLWIRSCEKIHCSDECTTECDLGLASELKAEQWRVVHGNETLHDLGTTEAVILSDAKINYDSARTRGLSQKVFTNISYNWLDNGTWVPYIGAGAEIELGQHDGCNPSTCCHNGALSQWSVWAKGGVSF